MSDRPSKEPPSDRRVMLAVLGFLATFLLFLVLMHLFYAPGRSETVDTAYRDARKAGIEAVKTRQLELVETYGWVDREKGIVRIPVERAMDLVVAEMNAGGSDAGEAAADAVADLARMDGKGGQLRGNE